MALDNSVVLAQMKTAVYFMKHVLLSNLKAEISQFDGYGKQYFSLSRTCLCIYILLQQILHIYYSQEPGTNSVLYMWNGIRQLDM